MKEEKNHEDHKNKIELTVRHGGNEVFLTENIHHKIQHVLNETLRELQDKFGLVPPPNNIPFLRYGSLDLADMNKSPGEYAIPDKAVLDLLFRAGGG